MQTGKLAIGCSIHGVDAKSLAPGEMLKIKDLLYKNRLIVLKDQALSEQEYCDFANRFGSPVPYLQDNYHHPEFPLIFVSSNVKSDGKQIGVARTGGYWHSDTSFEKEPKVITMLMPKVLPRSHPRSTKFIDMADVYAALPAGHQGQARRRRVPAQRPLCATRSARTTSASTSSRSSTHRRSRPARRATRQSSSIPTPGRRCSTPTAASRSASPTARSTSRPAFCARSSTSPRPTGSSREVRWSMGDIIIWDNRFLSHTSGRNSGPEEETMMYRITLRDDMPLCASQIAKRPQKPPNGHLIPDSGQTGGCHEPR